MSLKGSDEQQKVDFLVFGYACKLFRDDEKAETIDKGAHLIPWMGDEKLKIDRYDGRGALYDLSSHEAKEDYGPLADDEINLEQLCDKERYRSLYINEAEEALYKEEELKRTQQKEQEYAEVGYNYDVPVKIEAQEETGKPFLPPAELNLPKDMIVPDTAKHNAILERTALFLAQQGPQMEILMKVKQQGNKNFNFLSHTDPLHEYYKHLKSLIKNGSYVPKEHIEEKNEDEHYLHPSLVPKKEITKAKPQPPVIKEEPAPFSTLPEITPPEYIQRIIETMIRYVVKNGLRFETIISQKGDIRFSFLNPKNPYNRYYKEELRKMEAAQQGTKKKTKDDESKKLLKRKPVPVSFSIKKPKESEGLDIPSALPMEESSEEEESSNPNSPKPKNDGEEKHQRKDIYIQNERKMKVAQFLKDLKKKGT